MQELRVDIEIQGTFVTTGYIFGNSVNDACFKYDTSYVERPAGVPISISLPFQDEPFSPDKTRNYFEGLLPEGFSRKSVAKWMHADENDYLSILYGLGK
ncbi:MAG: HipA N-terminal domain-containing protein, partial [Lachnospiraceae bacterium]